MSIQLKKKVVEAAEHVEDVKKVKSLRRFIPNSVSAKVGRAGLRVQHKSPEILFATGIVLGAATIVAACRATLKLEGVLEDMESDLENLRELEERGAYESREIRKLKAYVSVKGAMRVGKLYAPSAGLAAMAVASLTGSHHIMNRRNVAITAAYAAVEKSFGEYRARVREEFGEEKERDILHGARERTIVEDTDKGPKKVNVKTFGTSLSPYSRVWDEVSSSCWKNNAYYNRMFIMTQQGWANDLLQSRGHLFLNEVHDMLGLERTSAGQRVGWFVGNGDSVVDFGILDRQHSDERVHEFMFGEEKSVLLDFNVDGDVYELLDKLNNK